jgi:hypothetical protein
MASPACRRHDLDAIAALTGVEARALAGTNSPLRAVAT